MFGVFLILSRRRKFRTTGHEDRLFEFLRYHTCIGFIIRLEILAILDMFYPSYCEVV